jgi:hypothetical protein
VNKAVVMPYDCKIEFLRLVCSAVVIKEYKLWIKKTKRVETRKFQLFCLSNTRSDYIATVSHTAESHAASQVQGSSPHAQESHLHAPQVPSHAVESQAALSVLPLTHDANEIATTATNATKIFFIFFSLFDC